MVHSNLFIRLVDAKNVHEHHDGPTSFRIGQSLFEEQEYEEAAMELWRAVLLHAETPSSQKYDVQVVFSMFLQCYVRRNMTIEGLLFVSMESYRRGNMEVGRQFLEQAKTIDPNHVAVRALQEEYAPETLSLSSSTKTFQGSNQPTTHGLDHNIGDDSSDFIVKGRDVRKLTPEQLYELAAEDFASKDYELCADVFTYSCIKSNHTLGPACANAVYCRTMIVDWGFNGTQYDQDMHTLEALTIRETQLYRLPSPPSLDNSSAIPSKHYVWRRATSIHPHMTLGYIMQPSILKRYVTESVAYMDEQMARVHLDDDSTTNSGAKKILSSLPEDLPYTIEDYRETFGGHDDKQRHNDTRIRIGFVGSGFNSKAVLYLSHDMFRFFNHKEFDVHVFSLGPVDGKYFLQQVMRGVDWRQRVINNLETTQHFHDCQKYRSNHVELARYIHQQQIHILLEWDGFARQGERAQGLFALRPAPVQILHQEYLGTSGASYVDYLVTDIVTSPESVANLLYTEKFIYMPNHFFSKGHAVQKEVKPPTYKYQPKTSSVVGADGEKSKNYRMGKGTPSENRCMSPFNVGPAAPSFVYCNFNKFLKNNPETMRSWIQILRAVPDSIICLLENPTAGIPYLRRFIHEAAGSSTTNANGDIVFVPHDGEELNDRIHFLPWVGNPFDHQARNQDFCHVMLDSFPYNGHTVAQDALYGGVPIVTRSDGLEMASRVTTSANIVLGFNNTLNAYGGPAHYEEIAIQLGTNMSLYQQVRTQLVESCLQRNPMHPYWDVPRYVRNFETGLKEAWKSFLEGTTPQHIYVHESDDTAKGTHNRVLDAHPPDGSVRRKGPRKPDEL
jgi:protein O-GlcNAc transferase